MPLDVTVAVDGHRFDNITMSQSRGAILGYQAIDNRAYL